jgi:drug/metabolite transporter (DMT)-like permease
VFLLALSARRLTAGQVDKIEWTKVKPYMVYVGSFSAGIYCNMKALERSNVDTVIVFRCCTPLVVAVMDYIVLGRELPNLRSALSLVVLLVGATGYVMSDSAFRMDGMAAYFWVTVYFFLLCFSMTYGKLVTDATPMKSMWGPALYSNFLSIPPTLLFGLVSQEWKHAPRAAWTSGSVFGLFVSCVLGVGISYTGWHARSLVTATTYTLVGVMNKMVTVAINVLIWDQHASFTGLCWLSLCIAAGTLYQQAPKRAAHGASAPQAGQAVKN